MYLSLSNLLYLNYFTGQRDVPGNGLFPGQRYFTSFPGRPVVSSRPLQSLHNNTFFGNLHIFLKHTLFLETYRVLPFKVQIFLIFFFFCTKEFLNDSVHSLRRKRRKSFIDSVDTRRAKILWIPTYTMVSLKDGAGNL